VPPLSVVIITKNEAANIEAALASVGWADERLVVDAESADATAAIARRCGAKVVVRPWPGYSPQKNFGASLAAHDWILSIDADERVSAELAHELRDVMSREPRAAGYRVPRVTWHLGRWIRSTDWYPDYQLRLYDRRTGRWNEERLVHESVGVQGPVATLRHELQHYAYRDIAHHVATMERYATLAAQQMRRDRRRARVADLVFHPPAAFLRNFVLRAGFKDGTAGFVVSAMNAFYVFLKFARLWELERCSPSTSTPPARGEGARTRSF
jgi:glycosyltransferase involved in cell wall biosynthesis